MITTSMHLQAPGFPRDSEDNELVNPFMSGYRLAQFVADHFASLGYLDAGVLGEDFGWLLVACDAETGLQVRVAFSSLAREGDDPNAVQEFVVSIDPCEPTRRRKLLFKDDISGPVRRLSRAVFDLLSDTEGVVPLQSQLADFD